MPRTNYPNKKENQDVIPSNYGQFMPNPRYKKFTPKKRLHLCRLISEYGGNISKACEKAKVSRVAFYKFLRRTDKQGLHFQKMVEHAKSIGVERLEDEARRRAMDGVLEPVYSYGEKVGHIRKYSDSLLMFLIKGHKKQYVDRYEVSGPDGTPIRVDQITANIPVQDAANIYAQMVKASNGNIVASK